MKIWIAGAGDWLEKGILARLGYNSALMLSYSGQSRSRAIKNILLVEEIRKNPDGNLSYNVNERFKKYEKS